MDSGCERNGTGGYGMAVPERGAPAMADAAACIGEDESGLCGRTTWQKRGWTPASHAVEGGRVLAGEEEQLPGVLAPRNCAGASHAL